MSTLRTALALLPTEIGATYEYPGYVNIPLPDGNSLNVGTANQEYGYDVAMALDGTLVGTSVTLPLDASAVAVADYMTRIYRHHARLIPVAWPLYVRSTADLATFITALNAEDRMFHFDDEPRDIITIATGKPIFTNDEAAHIDALAGDCDAFGGVWKMMENEPAQTCHKLIGVFGEDEGEVTK
jgi:hypothetical protein